MLLCFLQSIKVAVMAGVCEDGKCSEHTHAILWAGEFAGYPMKVSR